MLERAKAVEYFRKMQIESRARADAYYAEGQKLKAELRRLGELMSEENARAERCETAIWVVEHDPDA